MLPISPPIMSLSSDGTSATVERGLTPREVVSAFYFHPSLERIDGPPGYWRRADAAAQVAVERFISTLADDRRWKAALRRCWERAHYPCCSAELAAELQRLRNERGPSWLSNYRRPA